MWPRGAATRPEMKGADTYMEMKIASRDVCVLYNVSNNRQDNLSARPGCRKVRCTR